MQAITDSPLMYVERQAEARMAKSKLALLHHEFSMSLWDVKLLRCTPFGLLWRTGFVCASTGGQIYSNDGHVSDTS